MGAAQCPGRLRRRSTGSGRAGSVGAYIAGRARLPRPPGGRVSVRRRTSRGWCVRATGFHRVLPCETASTHAYPLDPGTFVLVSMPLQFALRRYRGSVVGSLRAGGAGGTAEQVNRQNRPSLRTLRPEREREVTRVSRTSVPTVAQPAFHRLRAPTATGTDLPGSRATGAHFIASEPRPATPLVVRVRGRPAQVAVPRGRTGGPGALNAGAARQSDRRSWHPTPAPAGGVERDARGRRRRWAC